MKNSPRKLISKLLRLNLRDSIAQFLRTAPLSEMIETQVGNHIYSGKGKLKVGGSLANVTMRIRIVDGITTLYLNSPSVGIEIECPFEPKTACVAVKTAVKAVLN